MPKNKIEDLRNHLFETLEALKDEDKPMDIERARTVAEVAKVIVESAKVEVAYVKAVGGMCATGFIPDEPAPPARQLTGRTGKPNGTGLAS